MIVSGVVIIALIQGGKTSHSNYYFSVYTVYLNTGNRAVPQEWLNG